MSRGRKTGVPYRTVIEYPVPSVPFLRCVGGVEYYREDLLYEQGHRAW